MKLNRKTKTFLFEFWKEYAIPASAVLALSPFVFMYFFNNLEFLLLMILYIQLMIVTRAGFLAWENSKQIIRQENAYILKSLKEIK